MHRTKLAVWPSKIPAYGLYHRLSVTGLMTKQAYSAQAIEVLKGLEPVQRRPGMYIDTTRPNHLAQEVIDNSVDEALAGFAQSIQVTLFADNSLEVIDDGRGMPVDIHPEEGVSGIELEQY